MAEQWKGYRLPQRTAVLDFEGTPYDGARVRCRLSVSLRTLLDLQGLAESRDAAELRVGFMRFGAEVLLGWNLEYPDGAPIPAGAEGMLDLDQEFAQELMTRWVQVVSQPPAPLGGPSGNGATSAGLSAPTVERSLNLGDLSRPS